MSEVVVYNRQSNVWDRLSPFELWVGQSVGDWNSSTSQACGAYGQTAPATAGPPATPAATTRLGSVARIVAPTRRAGHVYIGVVGPVLQSISGIISATIGDIMR